MIHERKRVPRIRFPEFQDEWQSRTLSELLSESKKRNLDSTYSRDDVLSVSGDLGIVNQIDHLGRSYAGESILNYHIVEPGDLVYTKSPLKANPYGVIKANKGRAGIVSTLYAVYKVNPTTCDSVFLDYYFALDDHINKYLRPLVRKGAKNDMKINNSDVLGDSIFVPDLPEQQKIAAFLTAVDVKIRKLSTKKHLLHRYRNGVMQRIFDQRIRFKDDNGNPFPVWETKKLKEFLTESRVLGSTGERAQKLTVKLWGKGVQKKNEKSLGSSNTQYYKRRAGQFIYSKLDFLNCAFGVIPDVLDGYESTIDLPCFDISSGLNREFLLQTTTRKEFYLKNGMTADGSRKARRVHADVFLDFSIKVPTVPEQHKIAGFFETLAENIGIVEKQLEKTKIFKMSLLQHMFV